MGGWILLGLGVWLHVYKESLLYVVLLRDNVTGPLVVFDTIPIALVAVGGSLAAIGFLGCCGSCTESVCFLGFVSIALISPVIRRRFCPRAF